MTLSSVLLRLAAATGLWRDPLLMVSDVALLLGVLVLAVWLEHWMAWHVRQRSPPVRALVFCLAGMLSLAGGLFLGRGLKLALNDDGLVFVAAIFGLCLTFAFLSAVAMLIVEGVTENVARTLRTRLMATVLLVGAASILLGTGYLSRLPFFSNGTLPPSLPWVSLAPWLDGVAGVGLNLLPVAVSLLVVARRVAEDTAMHLEPLDDALAAVAVGARDINIVPGGPLELHRLGGRFNEMVQSLSKAERSAEEGRQRLADLSAELAARLEALEARNREVYALNAELRRQVAERSRELELAFGGQLAVSLGSARLSPGDVFAGRFEVTHHLGQGGMGAVYAVRRLSDGRPLALKVMTGQTSASAARRFAREAEIAARIQHPRLVSVLDVGVTDSGTMFLAMELVQGSSLEGQRSRFGQGAWALPLLIDIAEGLAALHEFNVVHRDLKPANVLLETGSAGAIRAKISDFGIARWSPDDGAVDPLADTVTPQGPTPPAMDGLTGTGMLMGTPMYMAPELARGAQRAQLPSDVFSFGVMAWELLGGVRPWASPPIFFELAGRPLEPPAGPPGAVNAELTSLIRTALSADEAARPTAAALRDALRQATSGA